MFQTIPNRIESLLSSTHHLKRNRAPKPAHSVVLLWFGQIFKTVTNVDCISNQVPVKTMPHLHRGEKILVSSQLPRGPSTDPSLPIAREFLERFVYANCTAWPAICRFAKVPQQMRSGKSPTDSPAVSLLAISLTIFSFDHWYAVFLPSYKQWEKEKLTFFVTGGGVAVLRAGPIWIMSGILNKPIQMEFDIWALIVKIWIVCLYIRQKLEYVCPHPPRAMYIWGGQQYAFYGNFIQATTTTSGLN